MSKKRKWINTYTLCYAATKNILLDFISFHYYCYLFIAYDALHSHMQTDRQTHIHPSEKQTDRQTDRKSSKHNAFVIDNFDGRCTTDSEIIMAIADSEYYTYV